MSSHEPGVHQTTYKQPAGKVPTEATQATRVFAGKVEGQTVLLDDSSADIIDAERVSLKTSKASNVSSKSVQMEKSAAVSIESERTVLQDSAAVQVAGDSVRMVKSRAVLVNANETHLEDGSRAVLIITGGITGEARALVTVPAATVVAVILGLVASLVFAVIRGSRR
jgi:hypothetical protein